jgi:hypothetical protein
LIDPPENADPTVLTDWLEAACLFGRSGAVSRSEVQKKLEEAEYDDEEGTTSNLWIEFQRRLRLSGAAQRFRLNEWQISRVQTWNRMLPYAFPLLVSVVPYYVRQKQNQLLRTTKLFERFVVVAAKFYAGEAVRFGHPRDDLPSRFDQALDRLVELTKEPRGGQRGGGGFHKDEGVDVVAWRPFQDQRPGQAILLVQCATGRRWQEKTGEIVLDTWSQYVNWTVKPLRAIAIPFVLGGDTWEYTTREAGIVLDRIRITGKILGHDLPRGLRNEVEGWCRQRIAELRRL